MANTALTRYINDYNAFAGIFGHPPVHAGFLTRGAKNMLVNRIKGELSPEHLTCDGEASQAYVVQRSKYLRTALSELEVAIAV